MTLVNSKAMFEPSYPMQYTGDDCDHLLYGEHCRILREFAPMHTLPNGKRLLAESCEIETADLERFFLPRRYVTSRVQ